MQSLPAAGPQRPARPGDRRDAGGRAPARSGAAAVAGTGRKRLFIRFARVRRRSLGAGRRCRIVSRSRVFDRRRSRARVRPRSWTRRGGWPRGRRSVGPPVRFLRTTPAPALRVVPTFRARLLHARVPGSVFCGESGAADVPRAGHRVRRLLATDDGNANLGGALLSARPSAAGVSLRARSWPCGVWTSR